MQKRLAPEFRLEDFRQIAARFIIVCAMQSCPEPYFGRAFHDERAVRWTEAIRVRDEYPRLLVQENHCQPVKWLFSAEPDVFVLPDFNRGYEESFIGSANQAVCSIRTDQQITVQPVGNAGHIGLELQLDAKFAAATVEDLKPAQARHAGNRVTGNA